MDSMKPAFQILSNIIDNIEKTLTTEEKPQSDVNKQTETSIEKGASNNGKSKQAGSKKKKEKKEKKEKKPVQPALPLEVSQFLQCDLRVGQVVEVGHHPESELLYVLQVRYSESETRTICAGMRKFISDEEMMNRKLITICNLKPRKLRGIASEGMMLAGSVVSGEGEKETIVPLSPPAESKAGDIVMVEGIEEQRTVTEGKFVSGKVWDKIVPRLLVKEETACYDGKALIVSEGKVQCKLPDGAEIH